MGTNRGWEVSSRSVIYLVTYSEAQYTFLNKPKTSGMRNRGGGDSKPPIDGVSSYMGAAIAHNALDRKR